MRKPEKLNPEGEGAMPEDKNISKRKIEHLNAALDYYDKSKVNSFDNYYMVHNALPGIELADVDSSCDFLGRIISAPIMIGSLTGGPERAGEINRNLAIAAQNAGIALALGSAKIAFIKEKAAASFQVRDLCPDVPLLMNLGLVDLGACFSTDDCRSLMERTEADALIFHMNPLHEAMQAEGNTDFKGLANRLRKAVAEFDFPVIVKEVGHGISADAFGRLSDVGVYAVDVAGRGGTSWGYIESSRSTDAVRRAACRSFVDWGIPTADILARIGGAKTATRLIASGGVRNGIDAAKCICLGADLAAAAGAFLEPALESPVAVENKIRQFILEFRMAMFATGCLRVKDLNPNLIRKKT